MKFRKYIYLVLAFIITHNDSYCQSFSTQILIYKQKRYAMLVLSNSTDNQNNAKNSLGDFTHGSCAPNPTFEIVSYVDQNLWNDELITKFKIVADTGYAEVEQFDNNKYRNSITFPDSVGMTEAHEIIQSRKFSVKLQDSITESILHDLLALYIGSMKDQSNFIDSLKENKIRYMDPCRGITDCWNVFMTYELKVNKVFRKFNIVGLDYYKDNRQFRQLENNRALEKIIQRIKELAIAELYKKM